MRDIAHRTAVMYLGRIVEHAVTEAVYGTPLHPYTNALFSAARPADPDAPRGDRASRSRSGGAPSVLALIA